MARPKKSIEVCDRDAIGREKQATQTRRFSVEDTRYRLRLCEEHARMFDREMFGWIRLAHEEEDAFKPVFASEQTAAERRAAELRAAQAAATLDHASPQFEELEDVEEYPAASTNVFQLNEEIKVGEPTRSGWLFTQHAGERCAQRGYTLEEALAAAEQPEISYADRGHLPGRRVHQRGECAVVVETVRKVVITVLHRDEAKYALDHHHSLSERIAT